MPTPASEAAGRLQGAPAASSDLINILGVVYVNSRLPNGGELYRTTYGLACGRLLDIENWYEKKWFEAHRERLVGTSAVYRVPTKPVEGVSLSLVVKYSRVGEDVPINTQTLSQFIDAEFNSPWEEFSLVMEMRESAFGPKDVAIRAQKPLAIYVPPEPMQLWQTGRSRHKINTIILKHPGVSLDILRQYIMVYEWIEGFNVVETLQSLGHTRQALDDLLKPVTLSVIGNLEAKGYAVADMKPHHIIISEDRIKAMKAVETGQEAREHHVGQLQECVQRNDYSVIDYELLLRTPPHDTLVKERRRHSYLDDQRDRFKPSPMPSYLKQVEILGVPFVHGQAESTGGLLWVIGRNSRLFDYFLPERWRKTPRRSLSTRNEVYYTLTKDNINIVWKTSRVGEWPATDEEPRKYERILEHGFNSPFEVCSMAHELSKNGVPTVYMRAIYMTGSRKIEPVFDRRRYASHRDIIALDGAPILREDHNYLTIRGYLNGTDTWVAAHEGELCRPMDLRKAVETNVLSREDGVRFLENARAQLKNLHYDGELLEANDLLIVIDPDGQIVTDADGKPEIRICNLELVYPF